ncbi:MAG TPA: DUF6142 family protein [Mobilitalea sp.]|nr:DUF6142 family protein [Mobilitalea sp.]
MKKYKIEKKKNMIHFSGRRNSKIGIISALIGIVVVIGFIAVSAVSGSMKGKGGLLLGFIGLLFLFLAVFGLLLSYKAFRQRDIFYRFPLIGAILNGCMTIVMIIIYILGFGS